MAEPLGLYPLSSSKGEAIPYDIIRPIGLIRQDFTDTVSAQFTIPASADTLFVWASNTCILGIGATAVLPANGVHAANLIIIPAHTFMNIDHNGAAYGTVLGIEDPGGIAFIGTMQRWTDTEQVIRYTRR